MIDLFFCLFGILAFAFWRLYKTTGSDVFMVASVVSVIPFAAWLASEPTRRIAAEIAILYWISRVGV